MKESIGETINRLAKMRTPLKRGRKPKQYTIADLRSRFPLGATVYFKGEAIGTVCGYKRWINDSYDNEPEVLYVAWKIKREYPSKIGQFSARSPMFKSRAFKLVVYGKHSSGIGTGSRREITVHFHPRQEYSFGKVWFDETNNEWAIWEQDLHKVVR